MHSNTDKTDQWKTTDNLIPGDVIRFTEPAGKWKDKEMRALFTRTNIIKIAEIYHRGSKLQDKFIFKVISSTGTNPLESGSADHRTKYGFVSKRSRKALLGRRGNAIKVSL